MDSKILYKVQVMGFFSSIFKPVTSVIGGILGSNSSKDAAAQQQSNWSAQHQLAVDQFNFQKEYTKNRLQWQVEDAKKAGLHPMVAAGLSPTSFSPVSSSPGNPVSPVDYSWVGNLGQNLDYPSAKAKTTRQQAQALNFTLEAAQLQNEGLNLDNELKRMEIMSMLSRLTQSGPAAPAMDGGVGVIGGQDDAIKIVPDEVTASDSGNPSSTAGSHPLWSHARSGDFSLPVLSGNLADAVTENKEKNLGAEIGYAIGAWKGSVKRPLSAYTAEEKRKLSSGKYSDYYYPFLGWRVEPTMSWKNFQRLVLGELKDKPRNGGGGASWR